MLQRRFSGGVPVLRIYSCTVEHHQLALVVLAALICLASAVTGMLLMRRALVVGDRRWIMGAGGATGFGLWSTHFVALMGYRPDLPATYRLMPTIVSLGLAIMTVTAGLWLAARYRGRGASTLGALVVGCGVSAMHYVGVEALALPATIRFEPDLLALSVVLGVAPLEPALRLMRAQRRIELSCILLFLGVVMLHFTGMAAIVLIPSRMDDAGRTLLSAQTMSTLTGVAATLVILICLGALALARRTDALLRAGEHQFSILARNISDCALYMLTPDGRVANWNTGAERLKGYVEGEVVGQPFEIFYTPEDRAQGTPAMVLAHAAREGLYRGEGWRCRKDGTRFWAHVTLEQIHDDDGRIAGFAKITRDMTRLKEDQDRLAAMKAQRDTALGNMLHGLALFDASGRLVLSNSRLAELWDIAGARVVPGISLVSLVALMVEGCEGVDRAFVATMLQQAIMAPPENPSQSVIVECGDDFIVSVSSRRLEDGGWVATFSDVTERRRDEARIAHLVLHDLLTGLPNRENFKIWAVGEMELAAQRDMQFAVVAINLDGLRVVNDTHGQAFGDHVIRELGARFKAVCGKGERIARLGSDDFVAGKMVGDEAALWAFIDRLKACFQTPIEEQGLSVDVSACMGVAIFPRHGGDPNTIFNNADLALHRAKDSLGQDLCLFDPAMDEDKRSRRQLAVDLRGAVERGEMRLLFQPQHSLKSGALIGYEALARWHHPVRGVVSPDIFIPIAEETGEIFAIGEWVLSEAARVAIHWPSHLKVAVNLSPVQFQQGDLLQRLIAVVLDAGVSTRQIEFEITESAIIADRTKALYILRRIKALGISIAIDDFGTGHSSLDTLHAFPFDKIKIDRFFLRQAATSSQAVAIVRAVLALGKSLDIPVLAEGIETEEQIAFLVAEGCEQGQGYYYGRPQNAPSREDLGRAFPPPTIEGIAGAGQ